MAKSNKIVYMGTGRRKSSIARVRLVEGTGKITIILKINQIMFQKVHKISKMHKQQIILQQKKYCLKQEKTKYLV